MLSPPSAQHWLGTDAHGRDVYSRLLYGSRTALLVGFGASVLGATLGAVLGVASAYFGGRLDLILQRVMDVFLSLPLIILALAVVVILGHRRPQRDAGHHDPDDPALRPGRPLERARHPRDAVRRRGARGRLRPPPDHLPPHAAERDGAVPDHADGLPGPGHPGWRPRSRSSGSGSRSRPRRGGSCSAAPRSSSPRPPPGWRIFPGLAISLAVFAFNLFGDSLRDALDPRLRTQ